MFLSTRHPLLLYLPSVVCCLPSVIHHPLSIACRLSPVIFPFACHPNTNFPSAMPISVWYSLWGTLCGALSVWYSLCGTLCVALSVWYSLWGTLCVVLSVWYSLCGTLCGALSVWHSLCPGTRQELSAGGSEPHGRERWGDHPAGPRGFKGSVRGFPG